MTTQGEYIKSIRKTHNLTQTDLANFLGVKVRHIVRLESETTPLSTTMLFALENIDRLMIWQLDRLLNVSKSVN
tara:strand:- start:3 stop:224 length:222 start_codon:yes stop_codon:yes gene_type:complete